MRLRGLIAVMLVLAIFSVMWPDAASAEASPDYEGVTLNVGTLVGPFIASAIQIAGKDWEAKTGGKVNVVEFPFGDLYTKYVTTLAAGEEAFDVITFIPAWTPDFEPYLSTMPEEMRQTDDWQDIPSVYRDRLMVWNGKHLSQTIDGDLHTLNYRIDLFEDPEEQAAFKAKYGYDLQVPETWDQYYDIAEFFTRPEQNLWGTGEGFVRGGFAFEYFFTHVASYANHPDNPGSMFFDPETMEAQVNNPGWVRALEDWEKSVSYAAPGALNWGPGDIRSAFAAGTLAMSFDWGDTLIIAGNKAESQVAGNAGGSVVPGSKNIWNYETRQWDAFPEAVRSPFLALGGWQLAVPDASKHWEAAWNFIEFASSPEISGTAVVTSNTGINPYRYSHFNSERWLAKFSQREAEEYLAAQKGSLDAPNASLDMRIPGYFSYTEVLEIELSKVLAGQISAQEALDSVAEQWNALTDEFGREKQLNAYRASMGLPTRE